MKSKRRIKGWAELLVYVVLVSAFGFLATLANNNTNEKQLRDAEHVSLALEHEIAVLYAREKEGVSL